MIEIISWLAALGAFLTAVAMLSDAPPIQTVIRKRSPVHCGRYLLRCAALIVIVASSGVCLVFGSPTNPYDVLLRVGLVIFLSMQTPCPWWRYVIVGNPYRRRNGNVQ